MTSRPQTGHSLCRPSDQPRIFYHTIRKGTPLLSPTTCIDLERRSLSVPLGIGLVGILCLYLASLHLAEHTQPACDAQYYCVMIDSEPLRLTPSPPSKPCHNCRRKRLRCDRSIPGCRKCDSKGEKCLGYGNLFRWTNAVAVRGNLADRIPQGRILSPTRDVVIPCDNLTRRRQKPVMEFQCLHLPLTDPLLVDLGPRNRVYIGHCESHQSEHLLQQAA